MSRCPAYVNSCLRGGSIRPASLVKIGSELVGSRPYTLSCSSKASRSADVNVLSWRMAGKAYDVVAARSVLNRTSTCP
jgi:hypothetical protein